MAYQVIARKWRPQKFDDVVFQDHISKTLQNSIRNGRISHAYLFSGPRGVGKTTMARILAKALDCVNGPTDTPCGVCENCIEIKNGTSFDVIEIDGASNNGVEDVRQLRENVNFAPVKGKYKVYIIDEVHMVTTQAFNALLKTLEEPPPHVVFIFATTEYHKIPETILSRCQKFFFKKIPAEPIVEHLKHIAKQEGYTISDNALYPIARAADGAMRDAQSLLDQVISFSQQSGGAIDICEEDALTVLGIVTIDSFTAQLKNIAGDNALAIMQEVERVVTMGVDIPRYVAGFIDVLRSLRLVKNGVSMQGLLGLSDEEAALIKSLSGLFHDEEMSQIFRIAVELQSDLKYANNERVNLEMALLDMLAVKRNPSLAELLRKMQDVKAADPVGAASASPRAAAPARPEKKTKPAPENKDIAEESDVRDAWSDFMKGIIGEKQFLHDILKPASIHLEGRTLHIIYPANEDNSYYTRILDTEKRNVVKEGMSRRLGVDLNISVGVAVSGTADPKPGAAKAAENNNGGTGTGQGREGISEPASPIPDAVMMKNPEVEGVEGNNPTIEKIKDLFHGQIIEKKGE